MIHLASSFIQGDLHISHFLPSY
uniref:Uncharacterized protein n=1 Tax=Anguilla anguilla TaxID=7936 RepID=A0A0E9R3Z1_ANGAN